MEQCDVSLQVLLSLFVNPFLEIDEVESMLVFVFFHLQPFYEKREVLRDLFTVEDPVYHMAAKQSHLYFVSRVWVDSFVFMDGFKNVRSCRSIRKLQFIEGALINCNLISLFEVFDRHVIQNSVDLAVSVLKHEMSFHVLFF